MIKQVLNVFLFFLISTCFVNASFPVNNKGAKNSPKARQNMVEAQTIKVLSIDFTEPVKVSTKLAKPQKVMGIKKWKAKILQSSSSGKGWGIASFACGILAFAFPPLAILAIVFGAIGINKPLNGLAIAGLCLGTLALLITIIALSFFIFLFA